MLVHSAQQPLCRPIGRMPPMEEGLHSNVFEDTIRRPVPGTETLYNGTKLERIAIEIRRNKETCRPPHPYHFDKCRNIETHAITPD